MDMEDGDHEEGLSGQQEQKPEKMNLPSGGDHISEGIFYLFALCAFYISLHSISLVSHHFTLHYELHT